MGAARFLASPAAPLGMTRLVVILRERRVRARVLTWAQQLAVEAVLTEQREHVYHAVMLDPLTGALLTLEQIRAMVDEMIAAEARWLPGFVVGALHS